eukprot:1626824-Alexandrium_andersonii.AAC.1
MPHRDSLATGGCKPIATRRAGISAFTTASFSLMVPGGRCPRTSSVKARLGWARRWQADQPGRPRPVRQPHPTDEVPRLAWPGRRPGQGKQAAHVPSPAS